MTEKELKEARKLFGQALMQAYTEKFEEELAEKQKISTDCFRVTKIDGKGFFTDNYAGDLFTVEFTQDNGKSWSTMSTHLSFEGADKKMREYAAERRTVIDPTGNELIKHNKKSTS